MRWDINTARLFRTGSRAHQDEKNVDLTIRGKNQHAISLMMAGAVGNQGWRWAGDAWRKLSTDRRGLSMTPAIMFPGSLSRRFSSAFQSLRPERAALAAGPCVRPVRPADRRARSAGGHQECLSTIGTSFSRTPEKEMSMIQCPVDN